MCWCSFRKQKMKRRYSPAREWYQDKGSYNKAHVRINRYLEMYFCLKVATVDDPLPLELYAIIFYYLKKGLRGLPIPSLTDSYNCTSLEMPQIGLNLRKEFPDASLKLVTMESNRRGRFELVLNSRDKLHIAMINSSLVVVQGPYMNSDALRKKLLHALDPYYSLFILYQEWKHVFIT